MFQKYLQLYEEHLQGYIESLSVSVEEFHRELADVLNEYQGQEVAAFRKLFDSMYRLRQFL